MGMKFINKNGTELEFLEQYNVVSSSLSPIKEILGKNELTDWSIKLEEEELPFDSIFTLRVNVKKVGSISFLFKKEGFNKEEVVTKIIDLKEIKVKDHETAVSKVKSLFEITSQNSPLFVICKGNGDYQLSEEEFKEICSTLCFFVNKVEEESEDQSNSSSKFKLENPFKVLAKDKYHFIFGLVAAFLIGFTVSIAIFDIYLGKMIYIFFFICALAGMTLNGFIYNDSFKHGKIKSTYFILTVASSLVGYLLSFGGYYLFLSLSKDKPTTEPRKLLIIAVGLALILLSSCVAFIIFKIKQNKRAKK